MEQPGLIPRASWGLVLRALAILAAACALTAAGWGLAYLALRAAGWLP